jgi:uncharacterized membrane protein
MTTYFVAANGAQTGPFTIEEIESQCSRGIIQRETLMWREGLSDWQSAEQVLQGTSVSFSGATQSPPSPPPFSADSDHAYSVLPDQSLRFDVPAASLSASRGASWFAEGWNLFKAAPGMWIVALLIWIGIQILMGFIPVLGSLASLLLGPSFAVGLLAFAHGISINGNADLTALFAGFKDRLSALVVLALLYFVMLLAIMLVGGTLIFTMLGGAALFHAASPEQMLSSVLSGGMMPLLLVMLVVFTMIALVLSAYLYAPALVFFANQSASEALKQSFAACWRNWLPLLVAGLIAIVIVLVGALPFGLGLLIAMPVLLAANYASFKDMFGVEK